MLSKYIITMCVNIIIYIILSAFFSLEIFRGLSKSFFKNYHRPPHPAPGTVIKCNYSQN
jgi:hypothetical protein